MIEYTNATNERKQRINLLTLMVESGRKGPLYAEIIEKRDLRNWLLAKTNLYLNEKCHLFISLRNLERYEHNGLLLALDLVNKPIQKNRPVKAGRSIETLIHAIIWLC